ncbi:efflux RND transporter periplasmic adaptor subunit [Roseateles sp. DAIF2]|uniref:efflux RND transporter periplasmic adaptor subunit n=1 Tax=Roseateles sp. DAIF2 TaxID=2714952 RepID=UPI0018A2D78D|nr:efflux RND transporter periplasmic adaptor subunit [Roseateles sp. DAIF2]QPF72190.1 efflux RND transporter periplasmic adaptor subunit [Roseateles sp. DAIF2]
MTQHPTTQPKSIPSTPSRTRRLWAAGTALTAIAAVSAAIFGLQSAGADAPPPAAAATPVSAAVVQAAEVSTWDEFSGRLEAVERVELRPRVAGTVHAVHFREGALVKQGELLITIDPAPFAAEAERAEAQVAAAQARAANAKTELARAQRLLAEQAIAQREFDERSNGLREAEANLRAAQAGLQAAKLSLSYTQVRAPVSGRVGKLEITVGNQVAAGPGAPLLTTLMSVSPIYASFDADEQVIARALAERSKLERIPVQMGTITQDGTPLEGRLQLIDNQINAKSGTVRVRAVFDNKDGSLMPGQFARVRMGASAKTQALLVNERAVGTDQSKRFVMVVGEGNKAEYREVQLGAPVGGLRIVTAGLKPNERIVVNGLQRVRPGALLEPKLVAMDAKPEVQAAKAAAAAKKS